MAIPYFKIRHANIDDLKDLQYIFVGTIETACQYDYTKKQIDAWTSTVNNIPRWKEALGKQYFLVAERQDSTIGFASLKNNHYVDFLYVDKDYMRQGIASTLYHKLEREAQRHNEIEILSDVSKTAKPFFEKKGFKLVKENRNFIGGEEIINYQMIKTLTR